MANSVDPHAAERNKWRNLPRRRPSSIVSPAPGQQSVWDYPRPPRLKAVRLPVRVEPEGRLIALTDRALRVCETASPRCYYILPAGLVAECLVSSDRTSFCEWKGVARYWSVRVAGRMAKDAAWSYPQPYADYAALRDYLAFYPRRMDGCFVDDERVEPQPGFYYGGWVTRGLVGPFKGVAGSEGW
jgi:uncharacterized protein (DUF427 family)